LDVDFQADDRLVFREHFGREGRFLWSGFRHNGTKIIASAGGPDRFAKRGEEAFCKSEAAEEQGGIQGVAGQSVPEKGDAGDVAGEEASGGVWIAAEELPDGEIGDEEELDGAEERGKADADDGAAVAEPQTDGDIDEEAGVDDGD